MSPSWKVLVGASAVFVTAIASVQSDRTRAQAASPQAQPTRTPAAAPDRALLDKYCVTCHSQRLKTGGLVLEGIDVDHVGSDVQTWEKIARKIRTGEMPPPGRPRPDAAMYDVFASSVENVIDRAAAAKPNPGRVAFHRLNRTEYANAIRDVLDLDVDGTSLLPADETGYGFDNIANVLSMSPGLLERYKLAAWKISRVAIGDPTMKPVVEDYKVSRFLVQDDRMSEDLPLGSRGGTVIEHTFPLDGEYSLRLGLQRAFAAHVIRGLSIKEQIDVRLNGERIKLFAIGGECAGSREPRCLAFRPAFDTPFGVRELPAEYDLTADSVLQVRFAAKAGPATLTVTFLRTGDPAIEGAGPPRLPATTSQNDSAAGLMSLENVRIEGPFNTSGPGDTPSRRRILVCHPAAGTDDLPCAKKVIASVARRAYRRPVTDRDVQALLGFYQTGKGQGGFERGIQYALEGLLMSPHFLLRVVNDPAGAAPGSAYRLSNLELASRLSFFLWSTVPDDELLDAASRGTLGNARVLEQQVKRLLADPRASAFINGFFSQWLSLRDLRNVSPDPAAYPDFDDTLRDAFQRETQMFLESQVRENHGVSDLLTANYTFLNQRLAQFYGISGVYGSHFRRVTLTDPNRAGLLGQGSVLTVTSYSTRTSPVVRGKWLLTNLLGSPPPPPPPNIPALKENGEGGEAPSSVRARMEAHRKDVVCASCHARMDPMGFALENFSAIGKWRTTESGIPIDASGAFPDGAKFSTPAEFRKILLTHRDAFVRTLTEKVLTYALGRGVEYSDMPAVRTIVRDAAPGDYSWSSLVLAIVRSVPFQMNRVAEPEMSADQVVSVR